MRHRVGFRKLGRVTPHRIALLRNMATALFERERIRTTLMKAKELRPYAEKLITQAKRDDDRLHARRLVAREIHDVTVVKKLFDDLGARYATRPGGYTRILRLGPRRGDGAEMAIVELLGSEFKPEKAEDKAKKIEGEKKAESKPAAKPKAPKAPKAAKPAKAPKAAKAKDEGKSESGEKKKAAKSKKKGAAK
jgi:large subunit ribosomal protein L17